MTTINLIQFIQRKIINFAQRLYHNRNPTINGSA